jgi:hypothetical protein
MAAAPHYRRGGGMKSEHTRRIEELLRRLRELEDYL